MSISPTFYKQLLCAILWAKFISSAFCTWCLALNFVGAKNGGKAALKMLVKTATDRVDWQNHVKHFVDPQNAENVSLNRVWKLNICIFLCYTFQTLRKMIICLQTCWIFTSKIRPCCQYQILDIFRKHLCTVWASLLFNCKDLKKFVTPKLCLQKRVSHLT